MNRLQSRQLTFSYAEQLILDRVSLELHAGEVTVLLGANGAGKTTLLRNLCRQLEPDSGQVLIGGEDVGKRSHRELARLVALMPQHEDRPAQMRVIDVVSLGRAPHCGWWMPMTTADQHWVTEALQAAGVWELRERTITSLSGGEWRRMILARALAQQAPTLLLDEPTAGLDLRYQIEVLNLVKRMATERQMVIVMTVHDLHQAAMYGDRLALLSDNRLLAIGTPREVVQPSLIEEAFGVAVSVIEHPVHGTPLVVPRYPTSQSIPASGPHPAAPPAQLPSDEMQ